MKKQAKDIIKLSMIIVAVIAIVSGVVYAGQLSPSLSTITAQGYTLGDIYMKILNIQSSSVPHVISTTSSPSPSLYSLADIYNKLNTESSVVVPENIRSGVTMFGVTGTYTGGGSSPLVIAPLIPGQATPPMQACYSNTLIRSGSYEMCYYGSHPYYTRLNGWGAVEYCAHLNADGLSTSTSVIGVWRVPTMADVILNQNLFYSNSVLSNIYAQGRWFWTSTRGVGVTDQQKIQIYNGSEFYLEPENLSHVAVCVK